MSLQGQRVSKGLPCEGQDRFRLLWED
ncbi:unnamed protein product [Ectocarpus sp. CCAP 1310/34]|nr:unnamed protein product [Ectocarpus sp. CCAP 1310/34]